MTKICEKHGAEYAKSGDRMRCLECHRESRREYDLRHPQRYKKWHQSTRGKNWRIAYYHSEKAQLARETSHHKRLARDKVFLAVKKGDIIRPNVCCQCLRSSRVEAHHYLGYDTKHRLDIVWLCVSCHHSVHKKQ